MKIQHLLILPVLLILLISCNKDETKEEEQEDTSSYIKATFDWEQEFLDLAKITVISDSLPTVLDLEVDENIDVNLNNYEDVINTTMFVQDADGDFDAETVLFVSQITGTDTLLMFFEIFGDLEEKSYTYASGDVFEAIFGEGGEIPNGAIIPYLISYKSEASLGVAFAGLFGAIDFGTSTFEITKIDETTNEISGTFTFDWEIIDEDNGNIDVLKVSDGAFNNLPLIK